MWTDLQDFFDFEQWTRVNKEQFQFIKINQTINVESKPNRKPALRAKKNICARTKSHKDLQVINTRFWFGDWNFAAHKPKSVHTSNIKLKDTRRDQKYDTIGEALKTFSKLIKMDDCLNQQIKWNDR
jgi:hypothetical protein